MPRETNRARAERFNISEQYYYKLKREGVDVRDDEQLAAALNPPDAPSTDAERYRKAQADKMENDARLARVKADLEEGKTVTHESVLQDGMKAGLLIQQAILKLPSELPPILAGLDTAAMSRVLDKYAHDRLHELCIAFNDIGAPLDARAGTRRKAAKKTAVKRVGRGKRASAKQPARKQVRRKRGSGA